jgi:glycosyltransferase involved in cell wall biosynthesis
MINDSVDITMVKFSVTMCVYGGDCPKLFDAAWRSVLDQSLLPTEIVLVCDGPISDPLKLAVDKFKAGAQRLNIFFLLVQNNKNLGHGLARNKALYASNNELNLLCDADDINKYYRFETVVKNMVDLDLDVCGGVIEEFDVSTNSGLGKRLVVSDHNDIIVDMRLRSPFNQTTVGLKKSIIIAAGGYKDIFCNEDYDLWIRLSSIGARFGNTQDVLVTVMTNGAYFNRRGGWRYFESEFYIQRLLLKNGHIGLGLFCINLMKRLTVQVLLPSRIRKVVFRFFARS